MKILERSIKRISLECILLLVIPSIVSCISMEKTNNINSCDSRVHAYKNVRLWSNVRKKPEFTNNGDVPKKLRSYA